MENKLLSLNDVISADLNFDEDSENIVSTEMPLNILYEDDYILAINKPANMPVHPSLRHFDNTLSNYVKYYFESKNLHRKIRIVTRLDKDTSGVVIFAKNEYVQEHLTLQMKNNTFKKEYLGILEGVIFPQSGIIDAKIARKQNSIIERCVSENGKLSVTHYDVIKTINNMSLVHFTLETGRTHQIRVHSSYIGHPIIGDTLYGTPSPLIQRQALHAYKVTFIHPITLKEIIIEEKLPKDMNKLVNIY